MRINKIKFKLTLCRYLWLFLPENDCYKLLDQFFLAKNQDTKFISCFLKHSYLCVEKINACFPLRLKQILVFNSCLGHLHFNFHLIFIFYFFVRITGVIINFSLILRENIYVFLFPRILLFFFIFKRFLLFLNFWWLFYGELSNLVVLLLYPSVGMFSQLHL